MLYDTYSVFSAKIARPASHAAAAAVLCSQDHLLHVSKAL